MDRLECEVAVARLKTIRCWHEAQVMQAGRYGRFGGGWGFRRGTEQAAGFRGGRKLGGEGGAEGDAKAKEMESSQK